MNSFNQTIDPALIDTVLPVDEQGYPEAEMLADREQGVLSDCCGEASREMPDALRLERSRWEETARKNDELHTWPINYVDRFTNQQPTHECTTHSKRVNFEAARNRQIGVIFKDGPKKDYRYPESALYGSAWMSCESLYAQVNPRTARNPQQRGGAGVRQVLEVSCKTGMLPDKIQPREYGFKHSLHGTAGQGNSNQSSGPYISVRDFPEGWEETAKHFKPLEVIFPESWEDAVSLVLNGIVVSVGRNGHAIPWCQWLPDKELMAYVDSYNVIRYDSLRTVKSAWRGAFAIANVTTPNDWLKPAG